MKVLSAWFLILVLAGSVSPAEAQYKWETAKPMTFFVANGPAGSCGDGCAEWIAAEGYIGPNSVERLQSLLSRLGKEKLPIIFNSLGGLRSESLAMGRLLRQRGMTTGVGRTFLDDCEEFIGSTNPKCDRLKQSGKKLQAVLVTRLAECSSACFHAFLGAKDRWVAPGSHLSIHASAPIFRKGNQVSESGGKVDQKAITQQETLLRQYFHEMGFDEKIVDIAKKIPHESGHYLTRDEMIGFGIDRRQQPETPWMFVRNSQNRSIVVKYLVEHVGTSKKEFPTSLFEFSCSDSKLLSLDYFRGRASDRPHTPQLEFAAGDHRAQAHFRETTYQQGIENQREFERYTVFPEKDFIQSALQAGITVNERSPSPSSSATKTITLSPTGLSVAFDKFKCG